MLPPGEWDPKIRLDPPSKIPQKVCPLKLLESFRTIFQSNNAQLKEERLERLAETHKTNGSITNGLKKSDEELHVHEVDPGLSFTGR